MKQLIDDIRWAWGMLRLRRLRRVILFSDRLDVDKALQYQLGGDRIDGVLPVVAYPDAFWLARTDDIRVALVVAEAAAWRGSPAAWREDPGED